MQFTMQISHKGEPADKAWYETDDRHEILTLEDARAWALRTIERFNDTLKPYEKPRELHSVVLTGKSVRAKEHEFRKTNLVTLQDYRGGFDTVTCENCGCRARRYGLTRIVRQKPFLAKKWDVCPS